MADDSELLPTPPRKRDLALTYLRLVGQRGDAPDETRQVIDKLAEAPQRPLVEACAPPRPGLYALYLPRRTWPVYVGKASGRRGLQGRLADHLDTLRRHHNVDPTTVRCRFVVYSRRAPLAYLEAALIRHYRPPWNHLVGFGSGRARSGLPPIGQWEQRYPRRPRQAAERRAPYGLPDADEDGAVSP